MLLWIPVTQISLSCHTVSRWTEKWTRDKKKKHATLGSTNWKVKGQELQKSELIQKERVAQPQFQLSVTRTGAEDSAWGHRLLPKHLLLFFCTTVSFSTFRCQEKHADVLVRTPMFAWLRSFKKKTINGTRRRQWSKSFFISVPPATIITRW